MAAAEKSPFPDNRTEAQKVVDKNIENVLKKQKKEPKRVAANDHDDEDKRRDVSGEQGNDDDDAIFSSIDLKKAKDKIMVLEDRKEQIAADLKAAYDDAENHGIPRKDLKTTIKHLRKKMAENNKANVNHMLEMLGELPLFHFAQKAEHELIQRH